MRAMPQTFKQEEESAESLLLSSGHIGNSSSSNNLDDVISKGRSTHTLKNRVLRLMWTVTWTILYRPSPRTAHGWRRILLRLFGAHIGKDAHPYPSARVWAPWNLEMGAGSCLGDHVDCYSVDRITIGPHATVSQYSYLCSATHDYGSMDMPLETAPIVIGEHVWIAAKVFVGPGITVGSGAVIGACSVVTKDVLPWTVSVGNPARVIKLRVLQRDQA